MSLVGLGLRWATLWGARGQTVASMRQRLEKDGARLVEKYRRASASALNLDRTRHIIGIERWGQARLRTLLGIPAQYEEYDGYRPNELDSMPALADAFAATRAETLALVDALTAAGVSEQPVAHNELGEMDLRQWLVYLNDHATRESMVIR